jgi:hypothetical protein
MEQKPQIRPYRRFLTSAFHRRFVHAAALALIVSWDTAFWLGKKTSCACNQQRSDKYADAGQISGHGFQSA